MLLRELRWRAYSRARIRRWLNRKIDLAHAKWCFLLGVNNSGTTLLMDILMRHPELTGIRGEGHQLTDAFPKPWKLGVPRLWSEKEELFRWTENDDPSPALRAIYDWSYFIKPGSYFVEKSPPHTVRSRWLQQNFCNSCFIALVRSPYAVCEGMRRREGYEISRAARHWKRANEILLQDLDYLTRKILIRYEDLCDNCDAVLATVTDFLMLKTPFGSECSNADFRVHNADGTPSKLRNMNSKSLERLSADDIQKIDEIAGPLMERFGYTTLAAITK
jgi:hypothetical protein